MDEITLAIVTGLATGAATGVVGSVYEELKAILKKKYGENSDLVEAVEELEKKPDSNARKEVLMEEVAASKAGQDPEVLRSAQALLQLIKDQPDLDQHYQTAIGNYIAQAGRGGKASVNVNRAQEDDA